MRLILGLLAVAVICSVASADDAPSFGGMEPHALAPLFTYYYDAYGPKLARSSRAAVRPGRTALTVTYPSEASLSAFTTILVPHKSGSIHDVVYTWKALKNLASMFKRLEPINAARGSSEPHLFPQGRIALRAAIDAPRAGEDDLDAFIDSMEAKGKRYVWATDASSSLMLWPHGSNSAAVADLISVAYDEASGAMTLEVDLVDNPTTITEFEPHQRQTLDVDAAHYHFTTRQGVDINAKALLNTVQAADFKVKGLHVFAKGFYDFCWYVDISATPSGPVTVGTRVNVTLTNLRYDCDVCSSSLYPTFCQSTRSAIGNYTWTESNTAIDIGVQGPGFVVDYSTGASAKFVQQRLTIRTVDGEAWVLLQIVDEGAVLFSVDNIYAGDGTSPFEPNTITITGTPAPPPPPAGPPVAKLLLRPAKAYRHLHDPITLTAQALDSNNAPVAGANVSFSAFGDCEPNSDTAAGTTDTDGFISITLRSDKPGAVAVVAAAVNGQGVPVLSDPSHVIFFEEHHYVEDREDEYYQRHHHGRDADSYAKAAADKAVQQLAARI